MSYKLEKEGYEMYGFKLGDYIGSDKIIGFDNKYNRVAVMGEYLVKCKFIGDEDNLDDVSVILVDHLNKPYKWIHVNKDKIRIKAEIWNTTLIVQTLHCEPFETISKDGFEISYRDSTSIGKYFVNLGYTKGKCNTDIYYFSNVSDAQYFLNTLLELVETVNSPVPVVDLRVQARLYELNGWSIYVNSRDVVLQNSEEVEVIKWCKPFLKLETIKQQLEQILEHLGVKAEVRI